MFVADANGLSEMPRQPLHGASNVAIYLASVAADWPANRAVQELSINNGPGVLVLGDTSPFIAFAFELDDANQITALYAMRNPDSSDGSAPTEAQPSHSRELDVLHLRLGADAPKVAL